MHRLHDEKSEQSGSFCLLLSLLVIILSASASWAQNPSPVRAEGNWLMTPKYGYLHVGVGGALSAAQSDDIETVTYPFEIYPVSFDRFYHVSLGFKNILQLEYRKNRSNHDLYYTEETMNNGAITEEVIEIGMTQSFSEGVIKFNPLFMISDRGLAVFLELGLGSVENLDDSGYGFREGRESIYGIDVTFLMKYLSTGVAIEYHQVNFGRAELESYDSAGQEFGMEYFMFTVKIGVGLGM